MRSFVLVGCSFLLAICPSPVSRACKVWVPVVNQVDEAELIVVGYVVGNEENKYAIRTHEVGGQYDDDRRPYRQRWLHEATVAVTDVLKGSARYFYFDKDSAGNRLQSVRVLHDGFIQNSPAGTLSSISTDDRIRQEDEGIWLLYPGEIRGTYRREEMLPETMMEEVKRCLDILETGYRDWTPGWKPDAQTWAMTWGCDMRTLASAIVHDNGEVTLSGIFRGELVQAGQALLSSPEWERFIARLDASGKPRWTRSLGCGQNFDPTPVAGHGGSTLLVGDIHQACSILGTPMPWTGSRTRLIVNISSDGRVEWTQSLRGTMQGLSLLTAKDGGYRMMGSFGGELVCANTRLVADGCDWFIGDLTADGTLRGLRRVDRDGDGRITQVERGENDEILFVGVRTTAEAADVRMKKTHDVITGKMTGDGNILWADTLGGDWDDYPRDIAVAPDGMVFATAMLTPSELGHFDPHKVGNERVYPGRSFTALFAWSADGRRLWSVSGTGYEIEIGANGNIYCLGWYRDYANESVPEQLPPTAGDSDLFIECYNRDGQRLWVHRDGGVGGESPGSFDLLPNGRALVTGGFEGISFLAGQTLRPRGQLDVFVLNVPLPMD